MYLVKNSCIWAKVFVFGKKWSYSFNVVVFGQSGCIRAKCLYSGKVVVFGQKGLYSVKSGCLRQNVVVFRQGGCVRATWL